MSRFILFIFSFFIAAPLFCQKQKTGFDAAFAKEFFGGNPNLKESSDRFLKEAFDAYSASDLDFASQNLCASKFLGIIDEYGKGLPQGAREYFFANPSVLEEFIFILSPKDNLKNVFKILSDIWAADAENFAKYPRLAIAIAIVFDTQPFLNWPHAQVSEEFLKRELPNPVESFKMWVAQRAKGRLLLQTERLSVEELKYMVASLATDEDREWVRRSVSVNISNIEKLYASVPYDYARLKAQAYNWSGEDYRLKTIKAVGGICTDQSYYMTEVAKICGVPAFIFSGAGADGFHAWGAYMLKPGVWNFDVGRYEESRFVTGHTIDPQTWEHATDHSLESLRESFRRNGKYRANQIHTMFAGEFASKDMTAKAEAAAKAAILQDSRNIDSWMLLLRIAEDAGKSESQICALYENAIKAFSRYPDIDAHLRTLLIKRYRDAGKDALAEKLSGSMIVKTKSSRPDIAMSFARAELESDIASGNADKLYSSYKRLLSGFRRDGAMCFKGITIPIINRLLAVDNFKDPEQIIKITRQVLKPAKNSTLDANISAVESQVAQIKASNSEE